MQRIITTVYLCVTQRKREREEMKVQIIHIFLVLLKFPEAKTEIEKQRKRGREKIVYGKVVTYFSSSLSSLKHKQWIHTSIARLKMISCHRAIVTYFQCMEHHKRKNFSNELNVSHSKFLLKFQLCRLVVHYGITNYCKSSCLSRFVRFCRMVLNFACQTTR